MENSRQRGAFGERRKTVKLLTVGEIENILADFVADAAAVAPAKVVARDTGMTERHVRALRQREHMPGFGAGVALALQCPQLRATLGRLLGFMPPTVQGADAALAEIKAIAERYAEEGDQVQR